MHQKNAQNLTLKPQMMNAKASRLTSIALSACVILTVHWGQSIFEVKFLQYVCLFVTEATQYCVHCRLQQIRGSLANPLSRINATTSYENEASLH